MGREVVPDSLNPTCVVGIMLKYKDNVNNDKILMAYGKIFKYRALIVNYG